MQSYVIHLIRHGVSEGSLEGRYVGITDSPLSGEGRHQLQELKEKGTYPGAKAFFASPLRRCRETAEILYPGAEVELLPEFRECNFGNWENKTAEEITAEDPSFAKWMENGSQAAPPNGESGAAFMHRVCAAFEAFVERLMRKRITESVLITHGGVIMTILSAYGLPRASFYDWMTESGCGYSLRITPGLWMRSMVAEVYTQIPIFPGEEEFRQERIVLDLAREAADRAYGEKVKTEESNA